MTDCFEVLVADHTTTQPHNCGCNRTHVVDAYRRRRIFSNAAPLDPIATRSLSRLWLPLSWPCCYKYKITRGPSFGKEKLQFQFPFTLMFYAAIFSMGEFYHNLYSAENVAKNVGFGLWYDWALEITKLIKFISWVLFVINSSLCDTSLALILRGGNKRLAVLHFYIPDHLLVILFWNIKRGG